MQAKKLYPFQRDGVTFLTTKSTEMQMWPHKLLAFDPGLGKTVVTCVAAKEVKAKTALVVCPAPIKNTWRRQLLDWQVTTADKIFIVNSNSDVIPASATHVIVNYDLCTPVERFGKLDDQIFKQLKQRWWEVFVVDEAQRLKGVKSRRSKACIGVKGIATRAYWKWALSGTIVPNRPIELYPLLKSMCPMLIEPYTGWEEFGQRFCNGFMEGYGGWNFKGASHIDELRNRIQHYMMVRRLEDVYKEMPETFMSDVYFDIGVMAETVANTPCATMRKLVGLAKMPFVIDYLVDRLQEEDEKILVFTQHRDVTEGICNALVKYGAVKFYGGMSNEAKAHALATFKTMPGCRVLVANMQAAGEGVDGMQFATRNVVFAEVDWVHGVIEQCIGRVRRIGQEHVIRVAKCIAEGTTDEMSLDEIMEYARRSRGHVIERLLTPFMEVLNNEEEDMGLLERAVDALESIAASLAGERVIAQVMNETKPEEKPKGGGKKGAGGATANVDAKKESAVAAGGASDSVATQSDPKSTATSTETAATSAGASSEAGAQSISLAELQDYARKVLVKHGGSAVRDQGIRAAIKKEVLDVLGATKFELVDGSRYDEAAGLLKTLDETHGKDAANDDLI